MTGVTISLDFSELLNAFELKFSVKTCEDSEYVLRRCYIPVKKQITSDRACMAADYIIRSIEELQS